jgi:nitrogen regulatory protein PII
MKRVVAVTKPFEFSQIGKGRIFILDLRSAVHVRTGEPDAAAT